MAAKRKIKSPKKLIKDILSLMSLKARIITGAVLFALLAVVVLVIVLVNLPSKDEKMLNRFFDGIKTQGYSVAKPEYPEENTVSYDIIPSHDTFMVFNDAEGKIESVCLSLLGTDEVSRTRQATMISYLNIAFFDDLSEESALNLINRIIEHGGVFQCEGYECALILRDNVSLYYIFKDNNFDEEALRSSISEGMPNELGGVDADNVDTMPDGVTLIGADRGMADNIFGESLSVINNNVLFYKDYGVSIIYDENTNEIIYIDVDGSGGVSSIEILGFGIGDTKAEVTSALDSQGVNYKAEGEEIIAGICYNDINMGLTLSFKDDRVVLLGVQKED